MFKMTCQTFPVRRWLVTANTRIVVCYALHTHTHTHTHTHVAVIITNEGTNLMEVHCTFISSKPAGIFHKKGRTSRRSPKYFFFDLRWWFFEVLPLFYASCEGTVWTLTTSNRRWSKFESRNPLKRLHSSHEIVTESCFEYFMRFLCRSSPKSKTKLQTNVLFLQIIQ